MEKAGGMIDVMELLNEPTAYRSGIPDVLRGFWQDGYDVVRDAAGDAIQVMIGDGFLGVDVRVTHSLQNIEESDDVTKSWQGFLTYPSAQGVFMDFHQYQIFNFDQIDLSQSDHITVSVLTLSPISRLILISASSSVLMPSSRPTPLFRAI